MGGGGEGGGGGGRRGEGGGEEGGGGVFPKWGPRESADSLHGFPKWGPRKSADFRGEEEVRQLYEFLWNSVVVSHFRRAALAELVDAPDLGSGSERSESSSLLCRTQSFIHIQKYETYLFIYRNCDLCFRSELLFE